MPAVKRRYLFLTLLLTLLLPGFLLLAWSARLYLAEFLISSSMQQAGLGDIAVEIEQLSLRQATLSQLGFTRQIKNAQQILNAQEINIHYQPTELIAGNIESLEIKRLDLHNSSSTEPAADDSEAQPLTPPLQPQVLPALLKTVLDSYIVFDELSVNQISLHGNKFSVLDGKTLSLHGSNDDGTVTAELTLLTKTPDNTSQNTAADLPRLVFSRLNKDTLDLELRPEQSTGQLPAKINLKLDDTVISGHYQLSPPAMSHWLQAVTGDKDIAAIKTLANIKSSELSGNLSLDFKNSERLHVSFTSAAKQFSYDNYRARNIAFDIRLAYAASAAKHQLNLLNGSSLSAASVSSGETAATDSHIKLAGELAITDDGWKYNGNVSTEQFTSRYKAQQLILADINTEIIADAHNLQAEGSFSHASLPAQFSFVLSHNLSSRSGALSIKPHESIDLSGEKDHLAKLVTPWPYPFDLYTGNIKISADASWSKDKDAQLRTDISLQDSGGNTGAIVFSGLSFDHKLQILPAVKSIQASKIKLHTLDSGVPISNVSMQLAAKPSKRGSLPKLIVRQTQGEILGGGFTAEDFVYDLNRSKNSLLIKLNNIDLAEVVKTQQLEHITATGRLDGTLPVEMNKDGIHIAHGGLTNQIRGGTIRYTPETGTEQLRQNPLTGITLDALRDFRYSDLKADVSYLPDGELTINLALKGISPELDENRPVNLNINTEQNLVSLLKSLRFAQGISDSIDEQVRRMYQQTQNNN